MNRLEEIEYARFHALAQIVVDKEKGVEAFERYMKIAFPGFESRKKAIDEETKRQLNEWVKTGPLKVTPLSMPTGKSKMKRRARVVDNEKMNRVYDKLGNKLGKSDA